MYSGRIFYGKQNDISWNTFSSLRIDESFRNKQYPDHHIGNFYLEELKIDMIKQFPLDSLHLLYILR